MKIKGLALFVGFCLPHLLCAAVLEIHVNPVHQIDFIKLQGDASIQFVPQSLPVPAGGAGETYTGVSLYAPNNTDLSFEVSTDQPVAYPFHVLYQSCGVDEPQNIVLWNGASSNDQVLTLSSLVVSKAMCAIQPGILSIYPLSLTIPYSAGRYVLNLDVQ